MSAETCLESCSNFRMYSVATSWAALATSFWASAASIWLPSTLACASVAATLAFLTTLFKSVSSCCSVSTILLLCSVAVSATLVREVWIFSDSRLTDVSTVASATTVESAVTCAAASCGASLISLATTSLILRWAVATAFSAVASARADAAADWSCDVLAIASTLPLVSAIAAAAASSCAFLAFSTSSLALALLPATASFSTALVLSTSWVAAFSAAT
mmetsp:Transcript_34584/g.83437  ORF Transcript_34584/g.83437 Transcript_34584/m.83437 type:complete len:218 (+) Transcript_34584:567-1220(+)